MRLAKLASDVSSPDVSVAAVSFAVVSGLVGLVAGRSPFTGGTRVVLAGTGNVMEIGGTLGVGDNLSAPNPCIVEMKFVIVAELLMNCDCSLPVNPAGAPCCAEPSIDMESVFELVSPAIAFGDRREDIAGTGTGTAVGDGERVAETVAGLVCPAVFVELSAVFFPAGFARPATVSGCSSAVDGAGVCALCKVLAKLLALGPADGNGRSDLLGEAEDATPG